MSLLLFFLLIKQAGEALWWWGLIRIVLATPTPVPGAGGHVSTIQTYFTTLFTGGLRPIGWSLAMFMFGWAAITYMFPGERGQDNAKMALYRAVGGLILILLTESIIGIVRFSTGQNN